MGCSIELDDEQRAAIVAAADAPGLPFLLALNPERLFPLQLHGIITHESFPSLTKRGQNLARQIKAERTQAEHGPT